jgi:KaiC/GvpD/RAD55 family RecA-like ATPase
MLSRTVLLLLIVITGVALPHPSAANTDQVTVEVALYAHTDPSATSVGGRVLSLFGNATSRHAADVRNGLNFTLVPALSAPLRLFGSMDVYVWLESQESIRGVLRVAVTEVAASGSSSEIRSSSVTVTVPSSPYLVWFGLGREDYTLQVGSTIKLDIQFSPVRAVPVRLLWDHPSYLTRLVVDVESVPRITLRITDAEGRASTVFIQNETGFAKLNAEVSVEDPFHGTNVRTVSLSLTNSSSFLIQDASMILKSKTDYPFRLDYALPMTVPTGGYDLTVSVRDAAERTFTATRKIAVTHFYTVIIMLVDGHGRASPGLNVSIMAAGEMIETVTTNSTGRAVAKAPWSRVVGPVNLRVYKSGLLVYSREINLESDSAVQLVTPLYDWAVVAKFQSPSLPVSGANVELFLNGTLIASSTTDGNGRARFRSVPLGVYEVTIASVLGSSHFANVTHSMESGEVFLELPILSGVSTSTLAILALVTIVAVLGVFATTRRRRRAPRVENLAQLLGGSMPRSAVVMIVGPSGSGKSVLLQNMLMDSIQLGGRCVYVSNSELPSKIRDQLTRMGLNAQECEEQNNLRFIDAYSGETGAVSRERHSVQSPRDLTALGIQLTSCVDELGGVADAYLDSLTPIVVSGGSVRGYEFLRYYGVRVTKSGGNFLYTISTAIEPELLSRFEEVSDCVLQIEKSFGIGRIKGRLLVKKARGLEHEREWVGFRITSKGRIEFVPLPTERA